MIPASHPLRARSSPRESSDGQSTERHPNGKGRRKYWTGADILQGDDGKADTDHARDDDRFAWRFSPPAGSEVPITRRLLPGVHPPQIHPCLTAADHFTKPLQQPAVLPRTGSQADLPHKQTPVLQGFAAGCEVVQTGRVEDRGLEPQASSRGKTGISETRAAECAAVGVENDPIDPDLVSVIDTAQNDRACEASCYRIIRPVAGSKPFCDNFEGLERDRSPP